VRGEGLAQGGIGAVDLIARGPCRRGPGGHGPVNHRPGQCGLGRELALVVRHAGRRAPVAVLGPGLGQIDLAVDERVSGCGGVGEIDGDLAVLDPACGSGVLTLYPNRRGALLDVPGLVDHQHRGGVAEVLADVVTQVVPDAVFVPDRLRQKPLHPARVVLTGVLGDGPAVRPGQLGQQPPQERPYPPPWLDTSEPRPDTQHQVVEFALPLIQQVEVYCGGRSHRRSVMSLHKP